MNQPAVSISVDQSTFGWDVLISVVAPPFRPIPGLEYAMRNVGKITFYGDRAEADAREASKQLESALSSLKDVVPLADVDSLLEGIARQVGATQMTAPDSVFSGVVRSYQRDGAWRSMWYRMTAAENEAKKHADDNRMLKGEVERLRRLLTQARPLVSEMAGAPPLASRVRLLREIDRETSWAASPDVAPAGGAT